jgi:Serine proteases of the peptidase family S9A
MQINMKYIIITSLSVLLMTTAFAKSKISYPKTVKEDIVDNYFGVEVKEPYRWLENDTSVATLNWVKTQNKVTRDYLSQIPFRNELKKRMTALNNYAIYFPIQKEREILLL